MNDNKVILAFIYANYSLGREMGGKFKREGIYVYLWLIHVDVWQKPTQYCKAIILQLKIIFFLKELPFFFSGCICGLPDLSSPTMDGNHALWIGSTGS